METITEDYVSFETAKLLKEKGFEGECSFAFYKDGRIVDRYDSEFSYNYYDRPTHQLAMKWLRDVHNKFIQISAVLQDQPFGLHYRPSIQDYEAYARHDYFSEYATYKDACEAAIKYCLENLI